MKSYCKNFHALATSDQENKVLIARLRCKQWSCQFCAEMNRRQWYMTMTDAIDGLGGEWTMLTVTLPAWIHKQKILFDRIYDSVTTIKKNWDKLMKRLKRWLGKFQYVRVLESHKSGVLHVHMLINTIIPDARPRKPGQDKTAWTSKTLQRHLKESGFGYIHDCSPLRDPGGDYWNGKRVSAYVAKYLTKDLAMIDEERKALRVRKIQTSQSFRKPKNESDQVWTMTSGIYELDLHEKPRHTFVDVSTGYIVTLDHFKYSYVYPIEFDKNYE